MAGELVREIIIQEAPTDWISPPKLDARLAIQTSRKIGIEKAAAGLVDSGRVAGMGCRCGMWPAMPSPGALCWLAAGASVGEIRGRYRGLDAASHPHDRLGQGDHRDLPGQRRGPADGAGGAGRAAINQAAMAITGS